MEFQWPDILRDQDDDGLTDLYEHRSGLDYLDADTDDDAIIDGEDTPPLAPFGENSASEDRLAFIRALLEPVYGQDRVAAINVRANGNVDDPPGQVAVGISPWAESMLQVPPELFSGVVTDGHLLTYDQEMIDRLSNDYGVFSPTGFRFVFSKSDGSEYYVI